MNNSEFSYLSEILEKGKYKIWNIFSFLEKDVLLQK